ncbi:hypothetical protein KL942_000643 [Ogataea angusta]|uniref:Secreted protein n=1 Tax=Pichia angusta TaxID=870730 RepID=A0ABQ7S2U8_PICAN|nr:hypothetical protein KL942_000643 [Ogataea angusta]KAG7852300.1 hypothetical protein KL940_000001 [Ogataea angusta]KAG7863953.1 hypothetical protein KL919_001268 [Ogataea angusta]
MLKMFTVLYTILAYLSLIVLCQILAWSVCCQNEVMSYELFTQLLVKAQHASYPELNGERPEDYEESHDLCSGVEFRIVIKTHTIRVLHRLNVELLRDIRVCTKDKISESQKTIPSFYSRSPFYC